MSPSAHSMSRSNSGDEASRPQVHEAHGVADVGGVDVHELSAALAVAARLGLDLVHVDDVAEHVTGRRLHGRAPEIRAEAHVNPRHLVRGITLARYPAQ